MPAKKKESTVVKLTPESLAAALNKEFGPGTMKMASDPSLRITRLPTGILTVDAMVGGGFARNRHVEIYGPASVGKNYLALRHAATVQAMGGRAAFVDVEKTFDPEFAAAVGVDLENLAFHEQVHGPRCIDFMESLLRSRLYDTIIMDSIATLLPIAEYEKTMEAGSMGMEQAKLMSKALRKLTAANQISSLVFLNQTREAIGVTFGKKSTTSGGRAMGFYAGLRLELVRIEQLKRKGQTVDAKTGEIKEGDVVYGHRVLVRGEKDKTGGLSRPQEETTFVFDYMKHAHDHIEDLVYLGRVHGLVQSRKSGKNSERWWLDEYEDEEQAGRTKFKRWLRKNRAVAEELEEKIREAIAGDDEPDDDN